MSLYFFARARQSGSLFPLFRPRTFQSVPRSSSSLSVGRVKRKAPFSLSTVDVNEALLVAALIERRFTSGRYFINPGRLAARENLVLLCDPKAGYVP